MRTLSKGASKVQAQGVAARVAGAERGRRRSAGASGRGGAPRSAEEWCASLGVRELCKCSTPFAIPFKPPYPSLRLSCTHLECGGCFAE